MHLYLIETVFRRYSPPDYNHLQCTKCIPPGLWRFHTQTYTKLHPKKAAKRCTITAVADCGPSR
jgi:hypothetical protein